MNSTYMVKAGDYFSPACWQFITSDE